MKTYSKRITKLRELINQESYSFEQAVVLLKQLGTAKFIESVEAHVSLNIDPKYANQQLRTSLILPNGTGKSLIGLGVKQIIGQEKDVWITGRIKGQEEE